MAAQNSGSMSPVGSESKSSTPASPVVAAVPTNQSNCVVKLSKADGLPTKKTFGATDASKVLIELVIDGVTWETLAPPPPVEPNDGASMNWTAEITFPFSIDRLQVGQASVRITIQRKYYLKIHTVGEATIPLTSLKSDEQPYNLTKKKGDKQDPRGQVWVSGTIG